MAFGYSTDRYQFSDVSIQDFEASTFDYALAAGRKSNQLDPSTALTFDADIEAARTSPTLPDDTNDAMLQLWAPVQNEVPRPSEPTEQDIIRLQQQNEALKKPEISAEQINEDYKHLNFKAERPMTQDELDIRVERAEQNREYDRILTSSNVGFGKKAAGVASSFAYAASDPLNLAVGLIPIVGEARLAAIGARIGVTTARVTVGAAEAAIGTAALEPYLLSHAARHDIDYTLQDSLINVAFGSVLGGGFRYIGGKLSDRRAAKFNQPTINERLVDVDPTVRSNAMRTAIAQGDAGKLVDVEKILDLDPKYGARPNDTFLGSYRKTLEGTSALPGGDAGTRFIPERSGPNLYLGNDATPTGVSDLGIKVPVLGKKGQPLIFDNPDKAKKVIQNLIDNEGVVAEATRTGDGRFVVQKDGKSTLYRRADGSIKDFPSKRAANNFKKNNLDGDAAFKPFEYEKNGQKKYALINAADEAEYQSLKNNPQLFDFRDTPKSSGPTQDKVNAAVKSVVDHQRSVNSSRVASQEASQELDQIFKETRKTAEAPDSKQPALIDAEVQEERDFLLSRTDLTPGQQASLDAELKSIDADFEKDTAINRGIAAAVQCLLR